MTLVELKNSIHEKIDNLNDTHFLEMVNDLLIQKNVFVIPEHMKEGIRQGEDDIRNGRVFTMEDFEKKYEEWLKE
ncbi:hypothetical protein HQ865_21610 [Mucilaginibacter mali]|uniref:Addiction module component n=1 Tax=Mucilaginibacter mali TaxID=2740462 RepID=A0A7D4Q6A9_9SPHI|nr:hypothetical protein [Mucilaginibacter mali]QKJ32247.1 hypothetical protein HQ865_21610 [Mucilaginibacter mali]